MTALVYFFVAVLAVALSVRAWLGDRNEPVRQAFLGVAAFIALAYLSFALSLLPGLGGFRLVYLGAGAAIPAFALWVIDRLFAPPQSTPSPQVGRLFAFTAVIVPVLVLIHGVLYRTAPMSPPSILLGVLAFCAFGFAYWRLWEVHDAADLRIDRVRIRYLLGMTAGAVFMTFLEQLGRTLAAPSELAMLSLSNRGVVLQGPIPPVSALFTGVAIYFLYHTIVLSRLLDMHELFSRLTALMFSALCLVLVDGITLVWFGTFTEHPLHSTFQIFLGSMLFLAAYDPLKEQVTWWSNRIFNQRGQQLLEVLSGLRLRLPTVITTSALVDTLLSRLVASGRVPVCSVYLWDPQRDTFVCIGYRGFGDERPLATVAARPFTDALGSDEPWYFRPVIARNARTDTKWKEILATMDAMKSDLTIPFVSRNLVLGWVQVRDEGWSDGYSKEEIERLADIADLATVVLTNIRDFQALEQQHRLTALGAMAAGLAHEIRNPLAGIKGAAQYLQSETLPGDAQDMLQVVIDEADRLNLVVSEFLDYARPFELQTGMDHPNALVAHVLSLFRAGGVSPKVELVEDLAADIPSFAFDRNRLSQVLLNLLRNAAEAMPEGGRLSVTTRRRLSAQNKPVLEIAVADTGVGIPIEDLAKVFVPFYTTKSDGTGLGLAISERIVRAHGGELDVQSASGRGTTFVIRLPLPRSLEEAELSEPASDAAIRRTSRHPEELRPLPR